MTVTVGTDSFLSLTDADAYFSARLHAGDWSSADDPTKENALKMATARLGRLGYVGSITSDAQMLAWPRYGASDREGRAIADTDIPAAIRAATCELALAFLRNDLTSDQELRRLHAVRGKRVGDLDIRYDAVQMEVSDIPAVVLDILRPLLQPGLHHAARLVP